MRLEIKRTIIIGMIMFYAHLVNAQCGNMMSIAQNYYRSNDYANAKVQFQKIVEKCPSNADLAREYIRLCDEYLNLAGQQQNQNGADNSDMVALRQDNERLRSENARLIRQRDSLVEYQRDSLNSKIIHARNSIRERENRITRLVTDSTNYVKEMCALRELGIELNRYLLEKLSKDNKQRIRTYEGVGNDSLMGVFRENIKLVNDIKTPKLF